jgi:hypothetical protein
VLAADVSERECQHLAARREGTHGRQHPLPPALNAGNQDEWEGGHESILGVSAARDDGRAHFSGPGVKLKGTWVFARNDEPLCRVFDYGWLNNHLLLRVVWSTWKPSGGSCWTRGSNSHS